MRNIVFMLLLILSGCGSQAHAGSILIIGDSISDHYTPYVQQELPCVVHASGMAKNSGANDMSSQYIVDNLNSILAGGPYSVIHFNAGIHDLWEDRSMADYKINLEIIVERLQETGAVVIFATTTPSPVAAQNARIQARNAAAIAIMQAHGIRVDNLYDLMIAHQGLHKTPTNYHWQPGAYKMMGEQVAHKIGLVGSC